MKVSLDIGKLLGVIYFLESEIKDLFPSSAILIK